MKRNETDGEKRMWQIYGLDIRQLRQTDYAAQLETLPNERKQAIVRMRNSNDKIRGLGAGLLIAYGLKQAGVPKEYRQILTGAHGKPYLSGGAGVCFNVAHSGDYVIAVFSDGEVGIDIERRREVRESLIKRCTQPVEQIRVWQQADREMAFARLWAAKEAYIKWTGEGLSCPLSEIEIRENEVWRDGKKEPVCLLHGDQLSDYAICVCAQEHMRKKVEQLTITWLGPEQL